LPKLGYKQTEEHVRKRANAHVGTHLSDETKQKISNANVGKHDGEKNGMFGHKRPDNLERNRIYASLGLFRGENNVMFGKHHSEETRKKMSKPHIGRRGIRFTEDHCKKISDANKGQCNPKGIYHPNWKGGISFEPYCPKFNYGFKERVREFFGRVCVECKLTEKENGRKLDVHHVNYDKMVCCNDVKPLFVALCIKHNTLANKDRSYWEKHYTDIVNEKYNGECYLPRENL
jgi:hypothetical protein